MLFDTIAEFLASMFFSGTVDAATEKSLNWKQKILAVTFIAVLLIGIIIAAILIASFFMK